MIWPWLGARKARDGWSMSRSSATRCRFNFVAFFSRLTPSFAFLLPPTCTHQATCPIEGTEEGLDQSSGMPSAALFDGDDAVILPPNAGKGGSRPNSRATTGGGSRGSSRSSSRTGSSRRTRRRGYTPETPPDGGPRAKLKDRNLNLADFAGQYHLYRVKHRYPVPGLALSVDRERTKQKEEQTRELSDALAAIDEEHGAHLKSRWRKAVLAEKITFETGIGDLAKRTEAYLKEAEVRKDGPGGGESVTKAAPEVRSGFQQFMAYVRCNDLYNVERLVRRGVGFVDRHVNMREEKMGDTPLAYACSRGWAPMARLLLRAGSDPNIANDIGQYAIHKVWNHWGKGRDVSSKQEQEATMKMLRDLLAFGADPNVAQHDGWTALHSAARHGPVSAALVLLLFKGDPDFRDTRQRTALDVAVKVAKHHQDNGNHSHREVVELLRAWSTVRTEILNYEFINSWRSFCVDRDARLGVTPSVQRVLAEVDTEGELHALHKCDLPPDEWGRPVFNVVDEVLTGPVDSLDMTPQPAPIRIRAEEMKLSKGKIRPPRYPTSRPLEVGLDVFLQGEGGPKFLKRPPKDNNSNNEGKKFGLKDGPAPPRPIAKKGEESPAATKIVPCYATVIDKTASKKSSHQQAQPNGQRKRSAALHFANDVHAVAQLRRGAQYSQLHAPVRMTEVKEEGVYIVLKGKDHSNYDSSTGRPKTGAYLGPRLVPRRRANAREIEEKARQDRMAAIPASRLTDEGDIVHARKAYFSEDDVIAGRSVTRLVALEGEEHFHASHPRSVEKRGNTRAIPAYPHYQEPWINATANTAPKWDL